MLDVMCLPPPVWCVVDGRTTWSREKGTNEAEAEAEAEMLKPSWQHGARKSGGAASGPLIGRRTLVQPFVPSSRAPNAALMPVATAWSVSNAQLQPANIRPELVIPSWMTCQGFCSVMHTALRSASMSYYFVLPMRLAIGPGDLHPHLPSSIRGRRDLASLWPSSASALPQISPSTVGVARR